MYPQTHASSTRALLRLGLPLLLAAILLLLGLGLVAAQGPSKLTRITTSSDLSSRTSYSASLSDDGTRIAFASDSDHLGQGIPDGQWEIWLYDTTTMTFTRVTSAGGGRDSVCPAVSGDGTRVAFSSDNDFLGQSIPQYQHEIWLYDTATMTVTRVTTEAGTGDRYTGCPSPDADGTRLAFQSDSDFLGQSIPAGQTEIWLYDTATMTVTRVTNSGVDRDSRKPSISADGTKIAFHSNGDFLGQSIPDDQAEIWLYDTATMTVTRITTASPPGRDSYNPSISGDGTRVAFESDSDFLGQSLPQYDQEIWLYDATAGTYTRVTYTDHDNSRYVDNPAISADGTRIAFQSDSDFLAYGNIPPDQYEIWLYDTGTMTVTRVTTASEAGRDSEEPSPSGVGTKIAFASDSDFLGQVITHAQYEIWLWESMPALVMTKAVDDHTPKPGQQIAYTIVVANDGLLADATGAVVSDTLDGRLAFVGPVTLDPPGAGTIGAPPLLATDLTINAGGRITLTFPVMVTTTGVSSGTVIVNTAAVTSAEVSTPVMGSVSVTITTGPIGPAEIYLPVVMRSGS
jgi:uncharacterized repeat protein (TIGR01451 family)